jgi:hypothetical protein
MKKVVYVLVLAAVFALMFGSCLNATLDEPAALNDIVEEDWGDGIYDDENGDGSGNGNGGGSGGGGNQGAITAKSFRVDAVAGMSIASDDVKAGGFVADLTVPVKDGPWMVELDPDYYNNALFTVTEVDGTKYQVKVAEGVTLIAGLYQISLKIYNAAATEYYKTIEFQVLKTPAPFKKAPLVYPYIIKNDAGKFQGKNKLKVSWDSISGAKGYNVYVGTEPDERPETPAGESTGEISLEITDIEGDSTEGGLPDSTTYYVWVEAYNNSGETLSPSVKRRTTEPVNISGKKTCDFGDEYVFYDTQIYYGPALWYTGDILYHSIWNPEEGKDAFPFPEKGKLGVISTEKPAGVYVIKYQDDDDAARAANVSKKPYTRLYSAVYYWNWEPSTWMYIVNQWNSYAERTSFEMAIDYFTCANAHKFIKVSPDPYH